MNSLPRPPLPAPPATPASPAGPDTTAPADRAALRVAIIGNPNTGKTTLFNMLSGAFPASSGCVTLFGREITNLPANECAELGLARTFQITNLFPNLTVTENLLLALQAKDEKAFSMFSSCRLYLAMTSSEACVQPIGYQPAM